MKIYPVITTYVIPQIQDGRLTLLLNKHSDTCNYLRLYKLDVLKIVEYRFSCEIEGHVDVIISKRHFNV